MGVPWALNPSFEGFAQPGIVFIALAILAFTKAEGAEGWARKGLVGIGWTLSVMGLLSLAVAFLGAL